MPSYLRLWSCSASQVATRAIITRVPPSQCHHRILPILTFSPVCCCCLVQTSVQAANEAEEAYGRLLALEQANQGRVMSRPVSACARVLAPILLQACKAGGDGREQVCRTGDPGPASVAPGPARAPAMPCTLHVSLCPRP